MDPATTTTATATATGTVTTTAAASATCTGPTYTVQSGDACQSIGVANGIATEVFISDNGLDYNCTTLILGEEVCLGDSCDLYQVQTNNTCDAIFGRSDLHVDPAHFVKSISFSSLCVTFYEQA